ncbi:hypothetical protein J8L06_20830 [Bacteroides fragilis]|nr:hypothetical protein [Bacteroides fragilis]
MFNMEIIKENSRQVYDLMKQMCHYTFKELEQVTFLESTELCLALIELRREGKLEYEKNEIGVYYVRT